MSALRCRGECDTPVRLKGKLHLRTILLASVSKRQPIEPEFPRIQGNWDVTATIQKVIKEKHKNTARQLALPQTAQTVALTLAVDGLCREAKLERNGKPARSDFIPFTPLSSPLTI